MSSVVAIVKSIVGQVVAISPEGIRRVLIEGDRLLAGEQVLTGPQGAVTLQLPDGRELDMGRDSQWSSDAPTSTTNLAEATAQAAPSVAELQQAIAAGADPTKDLEATAAGQTTGTSDGGSAGGGHSVVMLSETAGVVNPNIGFATDGLGNTAAASTLEDAGIAQRASTLSLTATASLNEAGGALVYTASVTQAPLSDLTVSLSNGSVIVIPAGQTSAAVTIQIPNGNTPYLDAHDITTTITGTTGGAGLVLTTDPAPAVTNITDTLDTTTVSLTAGSATAAEGTSITYTATLSNPAQTPVTVTLSDGSTLTIKAGESSGSIVVPVQANDVYTTNASVSTTITGVSGGNFENLATDPTPAIVQITDTLDTTTVSLTAGSATAAEGTSITYTATLSNPAQTPVTVTLSDGSTLTIKAGESSGSVVVPVQANDVYTTNASVSTTITGASGGNFEKLATDPTPAVVQITDTVDTTTVSLTAGSATAAEGTAITYTATLSNPAQTPVTVTLSDGSTLTIKAGESSGSIVVPVQANDVYTTNASVSTTITGVSGGNFENLATDPTPAIVQITDTLDTTTVSLTAGSATAAEGTSITYTATLSNPAQTPVTVTLSDGSTLTIKAGESSGSVVVPVQANDVYTTNASVSTTITGASGGNFEKLATDPTPAVVQITDTVDTTTVSLTAGSATAAEGTAITYTATLSNPAQTPVTVTLSDGSTLTIKAGESTGSVVVPVQANDVYTTSASVSTTITGVSGGNFENLTTNPTPAVVQITDTLDTTTVSLTAGSATAAEGTSITYTATLSNPAQTPVTVTLSDGSTLTIKAGESSGSIVVPVQANDVYTTNASVSTTITGASGGNFENLATDPTPAVVQITDTLDTTVASIIGSTQVTEGQAATYTVSLSNPAQTEVTVNLTYSGTAADGSDYAKVVSVKIPANTSSVTFDLATINDTIAEGVENVTVAIGKITGGNFENVVVSATQGSVTTTIIDNDALPVVDLNGDADGLNSETTFTEGQAGVAIAAEIKISDVDSPNLQGANVTLTNAQEHDTLLVGAPDSNITVTTTKTNGQIVLTLTGAATAAEYEAVIKSITFSNSSDNPSVIDRNIIVTVNDGQHDSVQVTGTVHITAVNDAPTITFENPTYVENADAQPLVNNLVIKDVDGDTLSGAKITLTGIQAQDLIASPYYQGGDEGTSELGIGYKLSNGPAGSIVITLTGNASVANYTTLINSITYANNSENPSATPRGVTIEVTDVDAHGTDNQSGSFSGEINITPINDAPTVIATSGAGYEDRMVEIVLGGADFDGTIDHFKLVDMAAHGKFYADEAGTKELTSASDIAAANNSATVYFKPEKDWSGSTDFTYTAVDNQNLGAAPAAGTITVAPVTDMPEVILVGDKTVASLNVNGHTTGSIGDITGGVWHTDNSGDIVEISQPGTYGVAGNAQNTAVIELERNPGDPSNLYTNIDAKAGATYTISVDYSVRAGAQSNSLINVYWGDTLVGTLNNSVTGIQTYTFDVPITTNGSAKLEFKAGDSNSLGGVINNISVTEHLNIGLEDNGILLSTIKANTTDVDGSETLSLSIKGLPVGSALTDGVNTFKATAGNTSTDITAWDLSKLTFTPPTNVSGTVSLTVIATAQDGNAAPVSKELSFDVKVIAVADAPTVTTSAAQGAEDSQIQLNIDASLVDTDGSESLKYLTVSNIPLGATLTDGVHSYTSIKAGDGAVIIDGWDLSKLTITPPKDFNGQFTLAVSVTSTEASGQSATTTQPLKVTVTPVNDAPVLDLNSVDGADQSGYALTYIENGKPLSIAGAVSITDVDNATLKGAIVTLANAQAGDVLAISNQFGIKATVSGIVDGKITITLSGDASVASYEKMIQSVTYKNTSDNPSTVDRTLTVQVNDGQAENNLSNVATSTISVTAVNDAPVVDLNGRFFPGNDAITLPYFENAAPVKLMPLLSLSDPDSPELQSATVAIKDAQAGDRLVFENTNAKITVTSETVNGQLVYTLNGAATQAEYAAVLKSMAFVSEGEDPVGGNRVITVRVNDGQDSSNVATAHITVIPVNDAPTLDLDPNAAGTGFTTAYTENAPGVSIASDNVKIADVDNTAMKGAIITLTNAKAGDVLAAADQFGIHATVLDTRLLNGKITVILSGSADLASYQKMIQSITYSSTSENPDTTPRTITISVNDGQLLNSQSNTTTTTINVTAVNDKPVVVVGDNSYVENHDPVSIANGLVIKDVDNSTLSKAVITLTHLQPEDLIGSDHDLGNGKTDLGIDYSVSGPNSDGTMTITLIGNASVADYQKLIQSIQLVASGNNPTPGERGVQISVTDTGLNSDNVGTETSVLVDGKITVIAVNDAPEVSFSSVSYTENGAPIQLVKDLHITDVDSGELSRVKITLTGVQAEDVIVSKYYKGGTEGVTDLGIAYKLSTDAQGNVVIELSNKSSIANYETLINSLTYQNSSDNPSTAARGVTIAVTDADAHGTDNQNVMVGRADQITVIAVNDAPILDLNGPAGGTASTTLFTENGSPLKVMPYMTITDPDSPNLKGATVTFSNPQNDDNLYFASTNANITVTSKTVDGKLVFTLTGDATQAEYNDLLKSLRFINTSDDPSAVNRVINVTVNDGVVDSAPAQAVIKVIPVNDAPTIVAGAHGSGDEDAGQTTPAIAITLNGGDIDGHIDHFNLVDLGAHGKFYADADHTILLDSTSNIAASGNSATIYFVPDADWSGTNNFTYKAVDNGLTSNGQSALASPVVSGSVTVAPVTDIPTLSMDTDGFVRTIDFQGNTTAIGDWQAIPVSQFSNGQWHTDNSGGTVEIGKASVYGVNDPKAGNQVIELERNTGDASNLWTEFSAKAGQTYTVSVDYSPRAGALDNSVINVFWGTTLIGTLNATQLGLKTYTFQVPVTADGTAHLEFKAADSNSTGGILDNISVTQNVNTGLEDQPILLSAVHAASTDRDGSETLTLTLNGLPKGSVITDGTPDHTFTAGTSNASVDISTWDTSALKFTAPQNFSGDVALTLIATAKDGAAAAVSTPLDFTVHVIAAADAPDLTVKTATGDEDTAIHLDIAPALVDTDGSETLSTVISGIPKGAVLTDGIPGHTFTAGADNSQASVTGWDLSQLTIKPAQDYNGTFNLTVTSTATESSNSSTASISQTLTVNVTAVNDAPVIGHTGTGTEFGNTWNETLIGGNVHEAGKGPGQIARDFTLRDIDSTALKSATVTLTNFKEGDILHVVKDAGLTYNVTETKDALGNVISQTITFGPGTAAQYQTAIASITFDSSSHNPVKDNRIINITIDDGGVVDNIATTTSTIRITTVNDIPTAHTDSVIFTEGDKATSIVSNLDLADVDNTTLGKAVVNVTGMQTGELLTFTGTPPTGVTVKPTTVNGVVTGFTINGIATIEQYKALIESIKFKAPGDDPTAGIRGVEITVTDTGAKGNNVGTKDSVLAHGEITVVAVNDAPIFGHDRGYNDYGNTWNETLVGGNVTAPGKGPGQIAADITITDPDNGTLASATVTLTNFHDGDILNVVNGAGLQYTATDIEGVDGKVTRQVITFGPGTAAQYETAIKSITFDNSTHNPNTENRNITISVSDGTGVSDTVSTIRITTVNDIPTVYTDAVTFTEGDAATSVVKNLNLDDVDNSSLSHAVVSVDVKANDVLSFTGTPPTGVTVTAIEVGGKVTGYTIDGVATIEQYKALIEGIKFNNTSDDPIAGNRGVTVTVTDSGANGDGVAGAISVIAPGNINVIAVNDAPIIGHDGDGTEFGNTWNETLIGGNVHEAGKGPGLIARDFTLTDPDTTTLQSATVTLTNYKAGDLLAIGNPGTLSVTLTDIKDAQGNVTGKTITFGPGTAAQYQAAISSITFDSTSHDPVKENRIIEITIDDGSSLNHSASTISTIHITTVNDVPTVSSGAVTFTEGDTAKSIVSNLNLDDVDNSTLSKAMVTVAVQAGDQLSFTGQSITPAGVSVVAITNGAGVVTGYTISGTATVAQYKALIESIMFNNPGDLPVDGDRAVTIKVTDTGMDGSGTDLKDSELAPSQITVHEINNAPTVNTVNAGNDEDHMVTVTLTGRDADGSVNHFSIDASATAHGQFYTDASGAHLADLSSIAATGDTATLYFKPADDWSGSTTFTYTSVDNRGLASVNSATGTIKVAPVADTPTVNLTGAQVHSTGLVKDVWVGTLTGMGTGGNGADAATILKGFTTTTAATTHTIASSAAQTDVVQGTGTKLSGLIYLEAGHTYNFTGSADDSLLITLGGNQVASATWGAGAAITGSGFTPTTSGYYTLDIYHYNQAGPGNYSIGLSDKNNSTNAVTSVALDSAHVALYASVDDLKASGLNGVTLHENGTGTGEGYYTAYTLNHGTENNPIKLSGVTVGFGDSTDGSETHTVTVSGAPAGSVLTDAAGHSVSIASPTTPVDVSTLDLTSLVIKTPDYYSGQFDLYVTATATEAAISDVPATTPVASASQLIAVTVDPVNYTTIYGNAGSDSSPINGSSASDIIFGDVSGTTVVHGKSYNIAFILDSSSSMANALDTAKAQVKAVIAKLADSAQGADAGKISVLLVDFDTNVRTTWTFDLSNKTAALQALDNALLTVKADGRTNYEDAFKTAANWFSDLAAHNSTGENRTYFITDGAPNEYQNTAYKIYDYKAATSTDITLETALKTWKMGTAFRIEGKTLISEQGYVTSYRENGKQTGKIGQLVAHADGHGGLEYSLLAATSDGSSLAISEAKTGYDLLKGLSPTIEAIGINTSATGKAISVDGTVLNQFDSDGHATTGLSADQLAAAVLASHTPIAPGADTINGGDGNDILFGDVINFGTAEGTAAIKAFAESKGVTVADDKALHHYITDHLGDVAALADGSSTAGSSGGKDTLLGGNGNDILFGQGGDDILVGGKGDDIMFGGTGKNTFVWQQGDSGSDVVKDFSKGSGNMLDLSDLLQGENGNNVTDLTKYLQITNDGKDTTLQISSTGQFATNTTAAAAANTADVHIKVEGVTWSNSMISSLVSGADPTIKVDHH